MALFDEDHIVLLAMSRVERSGGQTFASLSTD
jgi:hypothetical protein